MFDSTLPIFLFVAVATLLPAGMLLAGRLVGPRRDTKVKEMPYESGMDPIHDTRRRFDIRFHLVAIAFLVFDVELLFLYPWAVASRGEAGGIDHAVNEMQWVECRDLVFAGVMLFVALLAAGFAYDWRKGVFKWR
ncbi:MAG: NADH-quinone oxidoreductase subunit A [Pirellulales bacterium]|nr:NADH-quinone oxidoreductase subunit A [Pirellulales bacterium]